MRMQGFSYTLFKPRKLRLVFRWIGAGMNGSSWIHCLEPFLFSYLTYSISDAMRKGIVSNVVLWSFFECGSKVRVFLMLALRCLFRSSGWIIGPDIHPQLIHRCSCSHSTPNCRMSIMWTGTRHPWHRIHDVVMNSDGPAWCVRLCWLIIRILLCGCAYSVPWHNVLVDVSEKMLM